jgi:F0F1-type ATP synthase assembly protein I
MTEEHNRTNSYRRLAVYSSVIFLLPSTLLGGYFFGYLLDDYFGTEPWISVAGLLLGGAGGFVHLFRLLNRC